MTSVLRQAFSNVKNLFFPTRENDDSRRAGTSGSAAPSFPTLNPLKQYSASGTKRHHDHFEAELTEDDDDYHPTLVSSKRLKTDDDISIVYYRKKTPQPNPFVNRPLAGSMDGHHYLENEENAKVLTYRTTSTNQADISKAGALGFTTTLGSQNAFKFDNEAKKSGDLRVHTSESKTSRFISSCFPAAAHRKEDTFKKIRHDKKSSKTKIGSWFNNFGLKSDLSDTVRLEEKMRYKQLLDKISKPFPGTSFTRDRGGILDQVNFLRLGQARSPDMGTPLLFSRTEKHLVASIHEKWDSNTSPSVVFKRLDMLPKSYTEGRHAPSISATPPTSGIRLFSVPQQSATRGNKLSSTRPSPSSPLLVHLDKEDSENVAPPTHPYGVKCKEDSVGTPGFSSTPASARRKMILPSFGDLNEAEAAGDLIFDESYGEDDVIYENSETSFSNKEKQSSLSQCQDDDLVILSESIVKKGRERRVNSLALEQTSSPYAQKSWLKDVSKEFKQRQRERKQQVEVETESLHIIRNESKIDQTLHDALRKKLMLTEIIELEEKPLTLPPITDEMKSIINGAVRPGRDSDVLGTVFNVDITRGDIKTLAPCKWLNDNVINVYMELIADRSRNGNYPRCHIFTTFFYPKYLKEGYSNALKRWTRKVDIFAHDLLIFPIHLGMHWCLAVADLRNKALKYYDSLGGRNDKCLRALMEYMSHEMKERKNQVLETTEWSLENVRGIPEQENGSDCGMFTCKFAECLAREANLDFIKQQNMNYYRERMIYELLKKDLLFP